MIATLCGSSAFAALRVEFEGVVSHFDAGYEAFLTPGEVVQGTYHVKPGEAGFATQQLFGHAATSHLLSNLHVAGASGWVVESPAGVVSHTYGTHTPGGIIIPPSYRYSVSGGRISFPSTSPPRETEPLGGDSLAYSDLNGNGAFDEGEPPFFTGDLPDYAPIEAPIPIVWTPIVNLSVAGPTEWYALHASSPLPPPLELVESGELTLNLEIFVPLIGVQRRTATIDVTAVRVVPEPASCWLTLAMSLTGLAGTRRAWSRVRSRSPIVRRQRLAAPDAPA